MALIIQLRAVLGRIDAAEFKTYYKLNIHLVQWEMLNSYQTQQTQCYVYHFADLVSVGKEQRKKNHVV